MWDYVHPSVCHILLMTKPFSPIFTKFNTSVLDKQLSNKLDSCNNRCSNSHMRYEPKISILEEYNFRLTLVASRYCPSQNPYTGPSILLLLKASMELPFRGSVWHRLLFSFHLCDILVSVSLYLDFHVWKQKDLRKEVSDLRGPML